MSIPTFKQYDAQRRRALASKYNIPLAEVRRLYGPEHFASDWADSTVKSYEAGSSFTTAQWNKLPAYLQIRVLRSSRALKMPGNVPEPWRLAA